MGAATVTSNLNILTEGPHVHRNLSTPQLVEASIARGEASLAANGALWHELDQMQEQMTSGRIPGEGSQLTTVRPASRSRRAT